MLDGEHVDTPAETVRLLGDPSRLEIVLSCLDGHASVGGIVGKVGLSHSLVSHHLRLLRATGLLKAGKERRHVVYSLPGCHVRDMLTNLVEHVIKPNGHDAHERER